MSAAPGTARGGDLASRAPRDAHGRGRRGRCARSARRHGDVLPPPDPDAQHRMSIKAPQVVKTIEPEEQGRGPARRTLNPYAPKPGCRISRRRATTSPLRRGWIYEQLLQLLLRSMPWRLYLDEVEAVRTGGHQEEPRPVLLYERCLTHLSKMPRPWLEYADVLEKMKKARNYATRLTELCEHPSAARQNLA